MTQLASRRGSNGAKKVNNHLYTLDSGKKIYINDYIYFDQDRTDRAYQVGRCMGPARPSGSRQISDAPPSIEVEILYRHRDLHPIIFPQSDHRRVYGSLRSIIVPVVNIKGKCTVLHRHHIHNFDEYTQTPNCFYFDQVYYQQQARFYDAVLTGRVKNIPARLQKTLQNQFQYLLCEPEVVNSITSFDSPAMKTIKENFSTSSSSPEEEESPIKFKPKVYKKRGRVSSERSQSSAEEDSDHDEYEGPPKHICDRVRLICTHNYPYRYYHPQTDIDPEDPQAVVPPPGVGVGPEFQVSIPAYLGPHPKRKFNLEARKTKRGPRDNYRNKESDSEYQLDEAMINANQTPTEEQPDEKEVTTEPRTENEKEVTTEPQTENEKGFTAEPQHENENEKDVTKKPQTENEKENEVTKEPGTENDKKREVTTELITENGKEKESKSITTGPQPEENGKVLDSSDTSPKLGNEDNESTSKLSINGTGNSKTDTEHPVETEATDNKDSIDKKGESPPSAIEISNGADNKPNGDTHLEEIKKEPLPQIRGPDLPNSLILFHAPTKKLQRKAERILSELKKYKFCIPVFWSEFQIRAMQEITRLEFNFKAIYSSLQSLSPIDFGVTVWTPEEMTQFEDLLIRYGSDLHTIATEFPGHSRADVVRQFFRWKGTMHKLASEDRDAFKLKADELRALALENTVAISGIASAPAVPAAINARKRRRTILKSKSSCAGCSKSGDMLWHHLPIQPYDEKESTYCENCASYFYRYAVHAHTLGPVKEEVVSPKRLAPSIPSRSPVARKRGRPRRQPLSRASSIPPVTFEGGSLVTDTGDSSRNFAATSPPSTPQLGPQLEFTQGFKKPDAVEMVDKTEPAPIPEPEAKSKLDTVETSNHKDPSPSGDSGLNVKKTSKRNRIGRPAAQADPKESESGTALLDKMCLVCHGYERNDQKISCAKCKTVVHKDCYLTEKPIGKTWYCDPCRNLDEQTHHKDLTCMICHVPGSTNHALKPTTKFNWGHVICAMLQPSIRIHLSLEDGNNGNISGISDLSLDSWDRPCQCCNQPGGFKAQCEKCHHLVHGSCALSSPAYQIGFDSEIRPVVRCPAHPSTMPPLGAMDESGQSLLVRHLSVRSLPTPPSRLNLLSRFSFRCTACNTPHSPMWWRGNAPLVFPYEMPSILAPYLPSQDPPGSQPPASVWCHACRWRGPHQSSPPSLPTPALH